MAKKYDTNKIPATFIMCKVAFFMQKKLNIRRMKGVLWIGKYGGADEIEVVCDNLSSEVAHQSVKVAHQNVKVAPHLSKIAHEIKRRTQRCAITTIPAG